MSRIAKSPVDILAGVEISISGQEVTVKGKNGTLTRVFNDAVDVKQKDNTLTTAPKEGAANGWAQAGTANALLKSMIKGVTDGYEKKLQLNGVGYRANAQGSKLNLTLGFSHPVAYDMPEGITIQTPTQTEIIVSGIDKQVVGQVAANIRGYRPPEPYKGKGVRYADEVVRRKEAKKK
ncbi:large subunit ribosomal protein L6 [Glaciecola punicea ACAM 611]|jgi:large subunit ribosomal protein L6|uniref:Large ribosomal subunit protein uL6 n=1 Tax=Glaciecola punicea ACAM 611 TaxID=1121923 RepID=H5TFB5_9ALTE|nr:50S ribosomal protein L6 [Glaciecola punicea]OFA32614.1 50S ribosomal protein L6 [Glaciecola punicea]GAB56795.1 large subunit ribosomal protein L6 [Glaciecola punicea ACAM 611]